MATATRIDPVRNRVAQNAEMAEVSFAKHQIEVRLDQGLFRAWRCGTPGTGNCAFWVTTMPGRIIVVGDIGDLIVERVPDMIHFSRDSIDDIGYFASKVPQSIETREYDADVAKAWIVEELRDPDLSPEVRKKLIELKHITDEQHYFCNELYESGIVDGCDFPDFRNWNYNFLWCRQAIKWLLSKLPEEPERK